MTALTEEQRRAAEARGACLVIAAAGSGKTTVLVERYLKLLDDGLPPEAILAVTFTNEAASQLQRRVASRLRAAGEGERASLVEATARIGTLHAFCLRLLRKWATEAGLPPLLSVLSPPEAAVRFDRAYRAWRAGLDDRSARRLLGFFPAREWRDLARSLQAHPDAVSLLPADEREREAWEVLRESLRPFLAGMDEAWRRSGAYDFDQLERGTATLLSSPAGEAARRGIRAVLVDEFQDTSPLQWRILSDTLGGRLEGLFAVGDPKQSIYRFRQADVRIFLSARDEIATGGGEVVPLDTNFRAAPRLLEEINALAHRLFRGAEIPFSPMRPGTAPAGESGPAVRWASFSNGDRARAETSLAASLVRDWIAEGIEAPEIALLFRASDRMPAFAEALEASGVPVDLRRPRPLFGVRDAVDVTQYLRYCAFPLDDFALAAVLRSPHVGLDYEALWQLSRLPGDSLVERVAASGDPALSWLVSVAERAPESVEEALDRLFDETRAFPAEVDAVAALVEPLLRASLSVREAIDWLGSWEAESLPFVPESPPTARGVRLLTVHAAKGLEFRCVLAADLSRQPPRPAPTLLFPRGLPPVVRARKNGELIESDGYRAALETARAEEREESKRLLYVALTRARERLTFLVPDSPDRLSKESWAYWLLEAGDRLPPPERRPSRKSETSLSI